MNPIYDLIVIGLIVTMVLVNLYSSREQSKAPTIYWSNLVQKLNTANILRQDAALSSHGSEHVLRD